MATLAAPSLSSGSSRPAAAGRLTCRSLHGRQPSLGNKSLTTRRAPFDDTARAAANASSPFVRPARFQHSGRSSAAGPVRHVTAASEPNGTVQDVGGSRVAVNGGPGTKPASGGATSPPAVQHFDFLVLGSGIAGLSYALKVAQHGRVALVTKSSADEGCTRYAQGGICAVLDAADSVADHVRDTMIAGAFLNDRQAVEVVCREGPKLVLELARFGAEFTRGEAGELHLTREGGHSARRIVHAADATGAEIERALLASARANPNIAFYEHHLTTDLVLGEVQGMRYCLGADVLDQTAMTMTRFVAPVTMLATGGAGQVYPNTTNPTVATGDGMAMAYRARATIANMEFVQFHPTSLFRPGCPIPNSGPRGRSSLITEAVRGEGGWLYNLNGERFMPKYDDRMELAPRDIVARAIQAEMRNHGHSHVLLDISHKPGSEVLSHFPNVAAECAAAGVDITRDPIPVVPAQHYMCGGVQTGLLGETDILGLYACGEVSCSGLHGANRLASNSLLEGLVFGNRAVEPSVAHADHALRYAGTALYYASTHADFAGSKAPRGLPSSAGAWVASKRQELRDLMWQGAGIVRRVGEMKPVLSKLSEMCVETKAMAEAYGVSTEMVELRNMVTVGELIMSSALQRKESRGGHYCLDYPEAVPQECHATVISRRKKSAGKAPGQGQGSAGSRGRVAPVGNSSQVMGSGMLGAGSTAKKRSREVSVRTSDE
ncbi:hypothetical protein N2152v2_007970 [Parachlorella kessleri]